MQKTSIEWCDVTWPVTRGCSRESPGCENCYAEKIAGRFSGTVDVVDVPAVLDADSRVIKPAVTHSKNLPFYGFAEMTPHGARWTRKVGELHDTLADPLRWRLGQRVFVNSMSDLWHPDVSDEWIAGVFGVMALAERHTFMTLTKRAVGMQKWFERMLKFRPDSGPEGPRRAMFEALACNGETPWPSKWGDDVPEITDLWPLQNVQLGVSVEDVRRKARIDHLRETPAAVRFISAEPLLEDLGKLNLRGIHQVIVGAESGHGARPFEDDWARSIRDQCAEQGVAFFLKQRLDEHGHKISLPLLDGVQHAAFPPPA